VPSHGEGGKQIAPASYRIGIGGCFVAPPSLPGCLPPSLPPSLVGQSRVDFEPKVLKAIEEKREGGREGGRTARSAPPAPKTYACMEKAVCAMTCVQREGREACGRGGRRGQSEKSSLMDVDGRGGWGKRKLERGRVWKTTTCVYKVMSVEGSFAPFWGSGRGPASVDACLTPASKVTRKEETQKTPEKDAATILYFKTIRFYFYKKTLTLNDRFRGNRPVLYTVCGRDCRHASVMMAS